MYWLAEQGLAPKRVLLVVVPLIMIFLLERLKRVFERKGNKNMGKMKNAFDVLDVLTVNVNCFINLSGSVAGGALLANTF